MSRGLLVAMIVVAVLLGLGGCGFIVYRSFSNLGQAEADISAAVDSLFASIENDSFPDVYVASTTSEFRSVTSQAEWNQLGESINDKLGALQSKSVVGLNVKTMNLTTHATVSYSARFKKARGKIYVVFRKVGGAWKLLSFRVTSPAFQEMSEARTCISCGKKHDGAAKFCPHCGASSEEEAENGKTESPANPEPAEPGTNAK